MLAADVMIGDSGTAKLEESSAVIAGASFFSTGITSSTVDEIVSSI